MRGCDVLVTAPVTLQHGDIPTSPPWVQGQGWSLLRTAVPCEQGILCRGAGGAAPVCLCAVQEEMCAVSMHGVGKHQPQRAASAATGKAVLV